MNDEQQLWRDVQRFMNQFPGFVAVAKKIGEVGDLAQWQEAENRKLELLKQEVEKQRKIITDERASFDVEKARFEQNRAVDAKAHAERISTYEVAKKAEADAIINIAKGKADKHLADVQVKAAEMDKVLTPKKVALEAEIAALLDKVTSMEVAHRNVSEALEKAKADHADFLKKLLGTT